MMILMSGYTMGFFFPRQVDAVDQAPKEKENLPERPIIDIGQGNPVGGADSQRDDFPSSMLFYRYF